MASSDTHLKEKNNRRLELLSAMIGRAGFRDMRSISCEADASGIHFSASVISPICEAQIAAPMHFMAFVEALKAITEKDFTLRIIDHKLDSIWLQLQRVFILDLPNEVLDQLLPDRVSREAQEAPPYAASPIMAASPLLVH